ncbi:MAG: endo-1,4-beta-xylanase [Lentisphaeria bacterium]|nr:endo-1,4-beta-xylanase [Lentisphaeria bacterium]
MSLYALTMALALGAALPKGDSLIGAGGLAALRRSGSSEAATITAQVNGVVRVEVHRECTPSSVQLRALNTVEATRGAVCLVTFRGRMLEPAVMESDTGQVRVVVEHHGAPFIKSLAVRLILHREWQTFRLPFEIRAKRGANFAASYKPGTLRVGFKLGGSVQTIELADFQAFHFGSDVQVEDLPRTVLTYEGRAPNAPWRKEAEERIRSHRKAGLTVKVIDAKGSPVGGAAVRVEQTRHEFRFGSAVSAYFFKEPPAFIGNRPLPAWLPETDVRRYRAEVERLFNTVVFESDMKHANWARHRDVLQVCRWFDERKIQIRGHALIWQNWKYLPVIDRERLGENPGQLPAYLSNHIRDAVETFHGIVYDWDVVNEPYANHAWTDLLGPDAMADWFRTARKHDPGCRLTLNEGAGVIATPQIQDNLLRLTRELQKRGVPVTGLGIHAHVGAPGPGPRQVYEALEKLSAPGLPIQITEFDYDVVDEQLAADYIRDFLTIVFSHPSVDGIVMWGFWDGRHWLGNAPLFRKDWSMKPAGKQYVQLVKQTWWTREQGRTGTDGCMRLRGFRGTYRVTVGKTMREVVLGSEGATLTLTLP